MGLCFWRNQNYKVPEQAESNCSPCLRSMKIVCTGLVFQERGQPRIYPISSCAQNASSARHNRQLFLFDVQSKHPVFVFFSSSMTEHCYICQSSEWFEFSALLSHFGGQSYILSSFGHTFCCVNSYKLQAQEIKKKPFIRFGS